MIKSTCDLIILQNNKVWCKCLRIIILKWQKCWWWFSKCTSHTILFLLIIITATYYLYIFWVGKNCSEIYFEKNLKHKIWLKRWNDNLKEFFDGKMLRTTGLRDKEYGSKGGWWQRPMKPEWLQWIRGKDKPPFSIYIYYPERWRKRLRSEGLILELHFLDKRR